MKLTLSPHLLVLKENFVIARDAYSQKETVIVQLSEGEHTGYGEACEHIYYKVTAQKMIQALEKISPTIATYTFQNPEQLWEDFAPQFHDNPFALCALDQAAHDLYGKLKGKPCYQLWNLQLTNLPLSNYTIGIGNIDKMIAKIKSKPFPIYKIKLGTDHDIEIIKALRAHTKALFRIDANGAWTASQTIEYAPQLKKLGVEFIEQPLPADQFDEMKMVYQKSVLPIIADESCVNLESVTKCHQRFHGINIKLMKCGGITPARQMIAAARKLKMKVMVGCMTEGSIGISAIAHLLPLLDFVDMDAAMLLKNNPSAGAYVNDDGSVTFSNQNGLGCYLKKR